MQLLLHIPAPYPTVNDPVPPTPPLASPYGFSMAAAARERALRRRKGATGLGEGKGGRGQSSSAQAFRLGASAPAAGPGARAVGGVKAGAALRPPVLVSLSLLCAVSRGVPRRPDSVHFP